MIRRELKKKGLILSVCVFLASVGPVHLSRPESKSVRCYRCLLKSHKGILHFTIVHESFALCRILTVGSVMNYFK